VYDCGVVLTVRMMVTCMTVVFVLTVRMMVTCMTAMLVLTENE